MPREPRLVFLERKSYRRRRMMDALRIMAVLGAVLWMIPVIWPTGSTSDATAVPMSHALFYVFGVWLLLIAIAAVLAPMVKRESSDESVAGDKARAPEEPDR